MPPPSPTVDPYDAVLVVSFGGPDEPDDVLPFLANVTRGRDVPPERLREVAEHYLALGGRSPINDQNRAFVAAVEEDFASHGVHLPVYWGNRNWHPLLAETVARMRDDGVRRAACMVTSAYASYSGCRQYRENLADAVAAVGPHAPRLDRLRHYFNHPGFLEPMVDATLAALAELPGRVRHDAQILYVTHSVPVAMSDSSGPEGGAYVAQHRAVVEEIGERVRQETGMRYGGRLVFCSRSGSPSTPWLEPDVNDVITDLGADDVRGVVVVPIGFVSDHMEVVHDLDMEARATAEKADVAFVRAATAGVDPRFVAVVRDLVVERAAVERGEAVERCRVGSLSAPWDVCPAGCCANPRGQRPAVGGRD